MPLADRCEHGGPTDMNILVNQTSSPEAKIALFRSLFRGREDVYPRRFESRKTGKSGYAPACANEWVRGICEKPRIKCAECPHRRFLPVTDDVIRWHLSGHDDAGQPFVAGVYPLLLDETCFFLAVDFDKAGWREDAAAFLETCRRLNLPAALERSRSGRGGHVWLFFEEAIPAALARRLGSHILTETMEGAAGRRARLVRPSLSESGHDAARRIREPDRPAAAEGPREQGNSVFLDDHFVPWADQWAFLASVRKIGRAQVEAIVQDAERRGRILGVRLPPQDDGEDEPWTAPPSRRRKEPPIVGELPADAGAGPRQSDLHRQGRTASGAPKPAASPGGVSESRVLQGAGDAAVHLRQAARHRLRRGSPASHRSAARLPRRCSPGC